ncbi:MAG TPA: hypothetical protein VL527_19770 [Dongiaceae bacterium]|nr:hypothetical protein [Dongiaceae bacterium]
MSTRPKLRRREFWLLLGVCVLVLLFIPVVRHYQLRAAARAYVAQLRAQGEKLDLAEVIPPPVPPEQDGSALLLQASALLDASRNFLSTNFPSAMDMVAPGRARIGWQQPAVVDDKASNSWADIELALAEDRDALDRLNNILDCSELDFKLQYNGGLDNLKLPHLISVKNAAQHLCAAAMDELHRGNPEAAGRNIRTMLVLANGLAHDRLVISELVRIAVAAIATEATWELLQATNATETELATLQRDWVGLDFIRSGENALLMERAAEQVTLAEWKSPRSPLHGAPLAWGDLLTGEGLQATGRQLKFRFDRFRWHYWWSYADQVRYLQVDQMLLETFRKAQTNAPLLALKKQQEQKIKRIFGRVDPERLSPLFADL